MQGTGENKLKRINKLELLMKMNYRSRRKNKIKHKSKY